MGFLSGGMSLRRFLAENPVAQWQEAEILAALAKNAFGKRARGKAAAEEGKSISDEVGWVRTTHLFDVNFKAPAELFMDSFVHVMLRADRLKAPAAILRSYQRQEEEAILARGRKEFLSRQDRIHAKEAAQARIEEEEKAGAYRRVQAWPLLIHRPSGEVYLGQTGPTASDALCRHFQQTFGVALRPVSLEEAAARVCEKRGWLRDYEAWTPTRFVEGAAAGEDGSEVISIDGQVQRYMGRELLTWLLFRLEASEGLLRGPEGGEIEFAVEGVVHLESDMGGGGRVTVRCDGPAVARETRTALAAGKQPARMGLMLAREGESWRLTLDAAHWTVSGLSITPPPEDEMSAEELAEFRFAGIHQFWRVLDALLTAFLAERLSDGWGKLSREISNWIIRKAGTGKGASRASA